MFLFLFPEFQLSEENALKPIRVALTGNPNCGKSTLFNILTGLNQKTGNFPGVTIEKRSGILKGAARTIEITDLPGTYSLIPKSEEEEITYKCIISGGFDLVVAIADATNLKRSLYYCSQLADLNIKMVIVINMTDLAIKKGIEIDEEVLAESFGIPVIKISALKGLGIERFKNLIGLSQHSGSKTFLENYADENSFGHLLNEINGSDKLDSRLLEIQRTDAIQRYSKLKSITEKSQRIISKSPRERSIKADHFVTHKFSGFIIFAAIMFLIFQSIFSWSTYPSDWITGRFTWLSNYLMGVLPSNVFSDLLILGVLPGVSGVLAFIPQIALLFFFISILEDSGYMARISFIMDKLFRKTGLNGRSIIPLIGGMACAVPSIMAARTIANKKERLLTILVTPFMSCSARLPVYTLLISLVIPEIKWFGVNIQGLTLLGLYLIGFIAAIGSAFVLKPFIKNKEQSYYIMEMPPYRFPIWKNILLQVFSKVKIFILNAGKVILIVSMVLWFLASYGPGWKTNGVVDASMEHSLLKKEPDLERSFAGIVGHQIEPLISPLGFDWKIGIALVTSFAAREVFVGTMSTIYNAGSTEDILPIKQKMKEAVNPVTGKPAYGLAMGLSLMIFYAFSMQCISTMVIVMKETKTRKWMLIQLFYMTGLAYLSSLIVYQTLK